MAKKLVNGTLRARLLITTLEKGLSKSTQKAISTTFVPLPEEVREEHAKTILEIIDSSRTEEEILEKVMKLSKTI